MEKFLAQASSDNEPEVLDPDWVEVEAESRADAAAELLRKIGWAKNPVSPIWVYVSIGERRHENGKPMALQKYRIEIAEQDKLGAQSIQAA